jgi:hypothetical protein
LWWWDPNRPGSHRFSKMWLAGTMSSRPCLPATPHFVNIRDAGQKNKIQITSTTCSFSDLGGSTRRCLEYASMAVNAVLTTLIMVASQNAVEGCGHSIMHSSDSSYSLLFTEPLNSLNNPLAAGTFSRVDPGLLLECRS